MSEIAAAAAAYTQADAATPKQRAFIASLIEKKLLATDVHDALVALSEREDLSKKDASKIIDELLAKPNKPATRVVPAKAHHSSSGSMAAGLPVSKYAIPAALCTGPLVEVLGANDHLFVEVREWKGTRYVRKLIGAPGSFSRVKLTWEQNKAIVAVLTPDPLTYGLLFSKLYTCCARCLAELTDDTSRATGYGPTCRGSVGL